jgi:hypothetical protein
VLNNDRKNRLIEETAHGLQYALGSIRTPVLVNSDEKIERRQSRGDPACVWRPSVAPEENARARNLDSIIWSTYSAHGTEQRRRTAALKTTALAIQAEHARG